MKNFYGNYLGLCINNADPEQRGRVQIFIPHIMPALYDRWNKAGTDRKIEIIGNNLQDALPQEDVEQLKKMLPWAEAASPIFGNSVAGHYNPQSGNFNETYVTENEAVAIANSGPASGIDYIFNSEARRDANGNVQVYDLPAGDGGGAYEVAGINQRYHPEEAAALRSLVQQGKYAEAEARAKNYIANYTNNVVGLAANQGTEYALRDAAFNRGLGGANWIAKYAAGITPNTRMNSEARQQILAAQQSDPQGYLQRLREGAERYELDVVGLRPQFIRGLTNRWNDRLKNSLSLLNTPPVDLTDPSSGGYPGSSNPAQYNPHISVESPVHLSLNPSQEAIQSTSATTSSGKKIGGGSTGNRLSDAVSAATSSLRSAGRKFNGYGDTYDGQCHTGTSGLVSVCIGKPGYFGAIGNGGAVSAIGTNYWTKGGYYEVLHASGTSKTGYTVQEGDIAVSTGGEYGHAKSVIGGQFRSDNLNDSAANVYKESTEIYRLTAKGQAAWAEAGYGDAGLLGEALADNSSNNTSEDVSADGTGTVDDIVSQGVVRNTTSTQPTVTDTTGMPQGLFSVPNPGAMLWVFFREGDPLFPVYFAASYGAREWNNAYKGASPKAHYPNEGDTTPRNQAIFRPNQAGGLTFTDTITDEEDTRSIRMFHANGAHLEMHLNGSVLYSPNEHIQQVAGNAYNSCLNREDWTQGINNSVTIGDRITIVGNISEEAVAAIEEHAKIVKDINKNMLKGG